MQRHDTGPSGMDNFAWLGNLCGYSNHQRTVLLARINASFRLPDSFTNPRVKFSIGVISVLRAIDKWICCRQWYPVWSEVRSAYIDSRAIQLSPFFLTSGTVWNNRGPDLDPTFTIARIGLCATLTWFSLRLDYASLLIAVNNRGWPTGDDGPLLAVRYQPFWRKLFVFALIRRPNRDSYYMKPL